jgi:hypothetical protein
MVRRFGAFSRPNFKNVSTVHVPPGSKVWGSDLDDNIFYTRLQVPRGWQESVQRLSKQDTLARKLTDNPYLFVSRPGTSFLVYLKESANLPKKRHGRDQ